MLQGWFDLVPVLWRSRGGDPERRRALQTAARGVILGIPLLAAFTILFASADPLFSRYAGSAFSWVSEDLILHGFFIGVFAWISGGALTRLWLAKEGAAWPRREPMSPPAAQEVLIALGLVNAVFLGFIGVQATSLFGGHEHVANTLGLTYSEYARGGFFQLVTAAALVLPTLLLAEWSVRDARPRYRRAFQCMGWLLIGSVAVVLLSAMARMKLYQATYGLTELRVFTQAFMAWLAFVFLWFGRTALMGHHTRFLPGAVFSGVLVAAALSVANPDAIIARGNLRTATEASSTESPGAGGATRASFDFDPYHATMLSGDAVPELVANISRLPPDDACIVANRLLEVWIDGTPEGIRSWNWGRWRARHAVAKDQETLRAWARCP